MPPVAVSVRTKTLSDPPFSCVQLADVKTDPQRFRRALRFEQQRAVNLAREKTARLAVPLAGSKCVKRRRPIEDQFTAPIGDHALRRRVVTVFCWSIVFENPKSIYERSQRRRR